MGIIRIGENIVLMISIRVWMPCNGGDIHLFKWKPVRD